ncbi:class I SAM-dependent methyltransferase [Magnetospirillum sp. UT-4]|uniref:class I SAM-dependent methyltransferase n=1 Tax=Magnetospirillum sp. UT-4 TaxID=2681467 RepID=UPI00138014AD|nr:class I SAM-dependent methyltransferase [Magnetospirillum sp. UT-4]CAA7618568.1 Methyltransferase type 11 [Magnetospirillum sp. UT-4]
MTVGFRQAAADFSVYRAGFPSTVLDHLLPHHVGLAGQDVVDLGCGDGPLARLFAAAGCRVTGIDRAAAQLEAARRLDAGAGLCIQYRHATAEATGLDDQSVDAVVAGQCWHWFDRAGAAAEVLRILRPGGSLAVLHFDWLPLPGNVVAATEDLIRKWNPDWPMGGGTGIYPQWLSELAMAGFGGLETFSYDLDLPRGRDEWRARIRASAGVAASLSPQLVADFDREHGRMLDSRFPAEPLALTHRLWAVIARKPGA